MDSVTPRSRPSLKDIARRVSVAPPSPKAPAPSVPPLQGKGGDTVRPVAFSMPPVPADHPALAELAQICERSVQEGAKRKDGVRLAPVASTTSAPVPAKRASKWKVVAPIMVGTLVAVVAVAVSAVVVVRAQRGAASEPPVSAAAAQVVAAPERPAQVPEAAMQPAPVESPAVAEVKTEPPESAPAQPLRTAMPAAVAPHVGPATPAAPPAAKSGAADSPSEAASPAPAEEPRPGDLSSAMAAAVTASGPAEEPQPATPKPDAPPDGSIPENPSQGAVQAALSGVRESARSCVVGMDEPSRATVVFGSSGSVSRVSVSGPAAGKGAESCIRTALSGAKVPPFRKPAFTVGITLRP